MTITECPLRQECSPETFLSPGARRRPSFLLSVSSGLGVGEHLQGAATGTVEAGPWRRGSALTSRVASPFAFSAVFVLQLAGQREVSADGVCGGSGPSTNRNVLCRGNGAEAQFQCSKCGEHFGARGTSEVPVSS